MQELPDPVTKITWDNAVLLSRKTARDLDVANGDLVEVTLNGRTVTGPIWTQPGMADNTLGLALAMAARRPVAWAPAWVSTPIPFSPAVIWPPGHAQKDGRDLRDRHHAAPLVHGSRPIVREANWDEFKKHPKFAEEMHGVEAPIVQSLYPNPLDEAKKTALHQWGMSIDLTACVGCGTCVWPVRVRTTSRLSQRSGVARP